MDSPEPPVYPPTKVGVQDLTGTGWNRVGGQRGAEYCRFWCAGRSPAAVSPPDGRKCGSDRCRSRRRVVEGPPRLDTEYGGRSLRNEAKGVCQRCICIRVSSLTRNGDVCTKSGLCQAHSTPQCWRRSLEVPEGVRHWWKWI